MALTQIDFDEIEEKKINKIKQKFELNKAKAVKKIVRDSKE